MYTMCTIQCIVYIQLYIIYMIVVDTVLLEQTLENELQVNVSIMSISELM